MQMDKIRFVGATTVDLPIIGATPAGPFILKGVDGLGPPERTVDIAVTIKEGGVRQGVRSSNRQVVARVGFQPAYNLGQTSETLRDQMYGLLVPKYGRPLVMQLLNGTTVKAIAEGDVSKCEASIFAKDPEVQVTMDCNDPYLLAQAIVYQTPTKQTLTAQSQIDVVNDGTAPAGFWMSIQFTSTPPNPIRLSDDSINYGITNGPFMSISGNWANGDILTIDTRNGRRSITRTRAGVDKAMVGYLSGASTWLQLERGDNHFLINNTNFNFVGNKFGHTPAYLGV